MLLHIANLSHYDWHRICPAGQPLKLQLKVSDREAVFGSRTEAVHVAAPVWTLHKILGANDQEENRLQWSGVFDAAVLVFGQIEQDGLLDRDRLDAQSRT